LQVTETDDGAAAGELIRGGRSARQVADTLLDLRRSAPSPPRYLLPVAWYLSGIFGTLMV